MEPDTPDAHGGPAALTIGDLARRTGLSPATLRMWESRHGFPVPHRLESGHRRYRETDVATIIGVLGRKDAGTRLELAIAGAMADAVPAAPSVFAQLRRRHPRLGVHRLKKSTLLALSWAIEDEFCAKADRARIYGVFQHERYFAMSEPRWRELARVSEEATVFARFEHPDPTGSPRQVALAPDAPMCREWAVVCDAHDLPVVLTAWELPGQDDVPDRKRLFESMWSVNGAAVHDAARVCVEVAASRPPVGAPGSATGGAVAQSRRESRAEVRVTEAVPDLEAVTNLFNRMVAYVDRIDGG